LGIYNCEKLGKLNLLFTSDKELESKHTLLMTLTPNGEKL